LENGKMISKRTRHAVSEIVGTVMLLGIAIALFSIVQLLAFSLPENQNTPSARLIGNVAGDAIHISHHGGESLELNTKLVFTIDGTSYNRNASEILNVNTSNGDGFWNIGEKVSFDPGVSLNDLEIEMMVVDVASNSVIMRSTIQV
jgi:flagellin-like protein